MFFSLIIIYHHSSSLFHRVHTHSVIIWLSGLHSLSLSSRSVAFLSPPFCFSFHCYFAHICSPAISLILLSLDWDCLLLDLLLLSLSVSLSRFFLIFFGPLSFPHQFLSLNSINSINTLSAGFAAQANVGLMGLRVLLCSLLYLFFSLTHSCLVDKEEGVN